MIGNLVSYGRKSANFNRPSHRMMPSSSMQGFSFINWLFFEIGFPDLNAVYSSQNASRCAKHTISSSASFISSGNSSILAFLLSLLRMLSNTLLSLACTRSKRIQLENRFGSSLHTPSLSSCFDAASFCWLFVKRVVQPFVSSFLCEVFFSGSSLGLFGSYIFDHSLKSFVSQSGPFHHKGLLANSEGVAPLVHKSAGFSSVKTCCHCDGSVNI